MQLGLATFGDLTSGVSAQQRTRELEEEAELADQLGLDVFAVGEHHRFDFSVSAPAVLLAAIAARTERIRLSSAVTVLSSDDPVRVFQQFAEKLQLLLEIRPEERVSWEGRHRAALRDAVVWPRPIQDPLPVWIAIGGTPGSAVRAGTLGLPLVVAIIGGQPERFVPLIDLYRRAGAAAGHDPAELKLAINTHAFAAETSARADAAFAAPYLAMMNRIGRERGWPPSGRPEYETLRSPRGALAVGSPEQIAEKILVEHELFGHERYLAQMSVGAVAHQDVLRSIELFGTEVVPLVRRELERRAPAPSAG